MNSFNWNIDYKVWELDSRWLFLNHGSFGACPTEVLEEQLQWRRKLEQQPVQFMINKFDESMLGSKKSLASLLRCSPADLAPMSNATAGVNTVLRSLNFGAGDEILISNHGYNACNNAARFVASRFGGTVRVANIPFPVQSPAMVVESILAATNSNTRLAIIDHVTSPTALVWPIAEIVDRLKLAGIDCLVDGAHAPGMLDLDLDNLGAAYYTGNCHKWLCTPKGAAFLHVRKDKQELIRPLVISHGANTPRPGNSAFQTEFSWMGTSDPSAFLCIPKAIQFMNALHKDGIVGLAQENKNKVLQARRLLLEAFSQSLPCPDEMLGTMAAIQLRKAGSPLKPHEISPLQIHLANKGIEVPIVIWPDSSSRLLRISAQHYNTEEHYRELIDSLVNYFGVNS